MNPRSNLFLLAVAVLAGTGYYVWTKTHGAPTNGPQVQMGGFSIPVEAAIVAAGPLVRSIPAVGSLRSAESVIISSEIMGRISRLHVEEGRKVAKGTLLVEISPEIYDAELIQAQARLTLSQRNHERALELQKQGAGTIRALDEAAAALRNDLAAVELAKARLSKTRITAPFDGVLGLRRVSVGAYLNPGDAIVNLEAIDPIKVDFRVPENSLTAVHVGQLIDVVVDALPSMSFRGELYAIDPMIDVSGRSVLIRAQIPNPDGRLRPGLFAHVNLIVERRENALLLAERALVPIGNDQFVFTIVDGKATRVKVRIGQRRGGQVEVVEGLSAGDRVVTDGQIKLNDGMPVMVIGDAGGMPAQ